tara:strand:- start:1377 stop:1637 length:261 start_codon:yes stop_codon:yes gene_type:complete
MNKRDYERSLCIDGKNELLHEMPLERLLECGYNIAATGCQCIGHNKAEQNEARFRLINMELRMRNEANLEYFDAAKKGTYNGIGAY